MRWVILAMAADLATFATAVTLPGVEEKNPVMGTLYVRYGLLGVVGLKVLATLAILLLVARCRTVRKRNAAIALGVAFGVLGFYGNVTAGFGVMNTSAVPPSAYAPVPQSSFHMVVVTPRSGPEGSPANTSRLTEKSTEQSVPPVPQGRSGEPTATPAITAAPRISRNRPAAPVASTSSSQGVVVTGVVSWYPASGLVGAVHSWRWGDTPYVITVCSGTVCIRVTIQDYCQACVGPRLVDLSDDAFRILAPLSTGVIRVRVEGWR